MKIDKKKCFLFLLGLLSYTQFKLIGYIGISEFVCYALAPFLFTKNIEKFRKWGFFPFLGLTFVWMLFVIISNIYNENQFVTSLKAFATVYSIFSISVCSFMLLYDKFDRIKWFLVGLFCSLILSIFIFQTGSDRTVGGEEMIGESAVDAVIEYKLFWAIRINAILELPIRTFFLKIPFIYSSCASLCMAGYALLTGGRSLFISALGSFFLLLQGRKLKKNPIKMRFHKNNILLLFCCFLVIGTLGKTIYTYSAKAGYLGAEEKLKYEKQSRKGTSVMQLLMAGRGGTFIGLFAAFDKPIFGHGSQAIDKDYKYTLDFMEKYGDDLDNQRIHYKLRSGDRTIPAHSYIIGAWMSNGLGGLIFWIYVLWLIYITLRENMYVVPEFFGWFAMAIPLRIWSIFFSPLGARVEISVLLTCMLLAKSVRKQLLGFRT